jgi:hypothetical protein
VRRGQVKRRSSGSDADPEGPGSAIVSGPCPSPRAPAVARKPADPAIARRARHVAHVRSGLRGCAPGIVALPRDQRPKKFYVGTREFDPVKVGFVTTQSADNDFLFRTEDASGKPIDGNSNAGHDYGNAQFNADDRKALVEYMKTL